LTLLQLDCGRGIGSNLCPLQVTSADASLAYVIDTRPRIESESNIDNGIAQRMIVPPGPRDATDEQARNHALSLLECPI
jgi:hypothetical protein